MRSRRPRKTNAPGLPLCRLGEQVCSWGGLLPYGASCPSLGGGSLGSHQPHEGGVQDQRGEPEQHASGSAAASGRLLLTARRWDVDVLQERLPSRRGPGPGELQFQLQLGGSERLWTPSTSPRRLSPGRSPAPPRRASPHATSPIAGPCGARPARTSPGLPGRGLKGSLAAGPQKTPLRPNEKSC